MNTLRKTLNIQSSKERVKLWLGVVEGGGNNRKAVFCRLFRQVAINTRFSIGHFNPIPVQSGSRSYHNCLSAYRLLQLNPRIAASPMQQPIMGAKILRPKSFRPHALSGS